MAEYSYNDIMKMQNDAIRRVNEMQRRAKTVVEEINEENVKSFDETPQHSTSTDVKRVKMPDDYLNELKNFASTSSYFDGIGGYYYNHRGNESFAAKVEDCCTVANTDRRGTNIKGNCTDITSFLRDAYSEHADLWDFKNTWTWSGKVNGKQVNVSCPHLAWE
jgi:hypothetical protein